MSENFADLFEQSLKETEMRKGQVVRGTVVKMDRDYIWVDAALKSEAVIPVEQFLDAQGKLDVSVGDDIDVVLEAIDNMWGETRLSRDKAKKMESWITLENAFENEETVIGRVTHHVRGGFTVEVNKLRAFMPGSLADIRPIKDASHLENVDLELKIVKLDMKRNNIVVSRRAILELETAGERAELLANITEGMQVKGIVKNITNFGAFVDLGGLDGLLHITDMSWSRINHPSDLIGIGDEIDVKIIKFDKEQGRLSLGMKQLVENPWLSVLDDVVVGKKVTGNITNITEYGCFVKIKDGVEGLVHTSEMDWTSKNVNPNKVVTVGQEVEVVVLEIDAPKHRISLGMKQCNDNPWAAFSGKYVVGDKTVGTVRSVTDFGLFIGLEGGIDGLIHISDISWTQFGDVAIKEFKKGQEIEAVLVSIDTNRERIALSIKQLSNDPYGDLKEGSTVKGTVIEIQNAGAKISLDNNIEGYIRIADISSEHTASVGDVLKMGQEIETKVISIDRKRRSINLSIKALEENFESTSSSIEPKKSSGGFKAPEAKTATLGDLLKKQMDNK